MYRDLLPAPPPPTVFKGNSDPFRATLIEITPRVIQAFQFLKDALIPSTHFNNSGTCGSWARRFLPNQTVRKHMESMNDEWSALAEMLPLSAALSRLSRSPELLTQTLQLKRKAIRKVHSELEAFSDSSTSDQVIRLTRTLFATATFENNMAEARVHGIALRKLLYHKTKREGLQAIDVNLMWSTLYYDAQVAHTTMSTSIFDVDGWATTRLRQATKPLSHLLEQLHDLIAQDLDPILMCTPTLQQTCIDIYEVSWLWRQSQPLGHGVDGPMMNLYGTTRHNIFQIRLSNHYLRLCARIKNMTADGKHYPPLQIPPETLPPRLEAITTLALMAYLASFVGNSRIGGQYLWPRIALFMSHLHHHLSVLLDDFPLERSRSNSNSTSTSTSHPTTSSSTYHRLLLFAYWVGATWEHNDDLPATTTILPLWFTAHFATTAHRMALHSWDDIKPVLDRFVPSELARPDGSSWVDAVLQPGSLAAAAAADERPRERGEGPAHGPSRLPVTKEAEGWITITRWYESLTD